MQLTGACAVSPKGSVLALEPITRDVSGDLALLVRDVTDVYVYGIANEPLARVDTTSGR